MTRRSSARPVHVEAAMRRRIRYAAAALAALTAAVYGAIAFDLVHVVDASAPGELLGFGLVAGGAFALGAVLLVVGDWRPLWLVGAAFQVLVIVMYVVVARERTPPFEFWGIMLRLPQLMILIALAYLSVPGRGEGRLDRRARRPA
jgi:peptidoglycan/LPS O-acetylase OafA/YrhL